MADSCEKLNFGITAPELSLLDSQDITDHLAYRKLGHFTQQLWRQVETNRFVPGWHIDAICEHLEAVTENQIRHLMVLMPPRHMKSLSVSVMWPAWVWLRQPHIRFLYASYAHSLSVRDSVKCRRIICSPRYWELASTFLPEFQLEDDQNTKLRFDNNYGGCRIATSVDGALTGEGGDIICLPGEALVNTEEGPIPIEEIVSYELSVRVWSFNHETGEAELSDIETWQTNPGGDTIEIELEDGSVLECTEDHPVYTENRGYVPAADLTVDDVCLVLL